MWKPGGRKFDLQQLPHKLGMLKEGEKYNSDLAAGPHDQKLFPESDLYSRNHERTKSLIMNLPLSSRTKRDFWVDEQNPREELPKYIKTEDEIPPFDQGAISMISKYDGQAKQQIDLVISGRQSYATEENKFDSSFEKNENSIGPKVDALGNPTEAGRREEFRKKQELDRAEMMQTGSSL